MIFSDIIGNKDTKTRLIVAAQSAVQRNSSVPHMLFEGPPGTGKTTFACALADFLGTDFIQVNPLTIKDQQSLTELVAEFDTTGFDAGGNIVGEISSPVVFMDEIHNLPLKGQELLGIAMENWRVNVSIKRGRKTESKIAWIPRFTLVGATTLAGKLSKPFRDRFKQFFKFETYSHEESLEVVRLHASLLGINIDTDACSAIASRGRGVPRILVRYLENIRDFALVLCKETVTKDVVEATFQILGVKESGLTKTDMKLLEMLHDAGGEPLGLDTLSIVLDESPLSVNHEIEPYLIQQGYISRTPRGRVLTERGESLIRKELGIQDTYLFCSAGKYNDETKSGI